MRCGGSVGGIWRLCGECIPLWERACSRRPRRGLLTLHQLPRHPLIGKHAHRIHRLTGAVANLQNHRAGLIGQFQIDLIGLACGIDSPWPRAVYALIGLSGLWQAIWLATHKPTAQLV